VNKVERPGFQRESRIREVVALRWPRVEGAATGDRTGKSKTRSPSERGERGNTPAGVESGYERLETRVWGGHGGAGVTKRHYLRIPS